jgi:hypothetical protein
MSTVDSLWPSEVSLSDTLGSDANTLDESVFLAVHQPMRFRRVEYGKTAAHAPVVSEHDLLEALLTDTGEGRVIVPIAGPSGAGKSHVIKWLDAELKHRADAATRHVILVPKSSSLKSVLKRILHDLVGPRYDAIRKTLEGASESLPEVAARDLRTRIGRVLRSEADAAQERLRAGVSTEKADQSAVWGRELADLLDDPELWRHHFYGDETKPTGVMFRLADRVTREGSADRRCQFEANDFDGLTSLVAPSDLSRGARAPIKRLADKRWQQVAADILNSVLDQATQNLLDLGGTPLNEVFLEMRRALLEDRKELVILVEDFAVLSGMQGALLDALIHEARVAGRREYCTIRSALAYTHGYQPMDRDTVRTRARAEWLIEDVPGSESEILDRAVELVGAYWNAARWGTAALRNQRVRAESHQQWVQIFEPKNVDDDYSTRVEAFGRTRAGYPLFPLNAAATRQLVREKSVVNNQFVFNPRLIIDGVVWDVAKQRLHFERGVFPPRSLGNARLTAADVIAVINRQPRDQTERLLTLVTYWADRPDSLGEAARLPGAIYQAFGLSVVDFGLPAPLPAAPAAPEQAGSVVTAASDPFDREWKPVLDSWQKGNLLEQGPASKLRTCIADAVLETIPPDSPGARPWIEKSTLARSHIYLPNARGAGGLRAADAAISLCGDDVWSDPLRAAPIRQALESVIRFHGVEETKGTWNYAGSERHAARYANFVASRRTGLLEWLAEQRESRQRQEGFSLAHLVENRLMAAAVLGVGVRGGNQFESALDVLFKDLPKPDVDLGAPEEWRRLLSEAEQHGAVQNAERSRADLVERIAARQGTGSKVLAIDVASLHGPVREFLKRWEFSDGSKEQNSFARMLQRGVKARQAEVRDWLTGATAWLGDAFDKQALIDDTRELLTEAKHWGLARVEDIDTVRELLSQFRESAAAESLSNAQVALRGLGDGTALPALAHHDATVAGVIKELGECLGRLFADIEDGINSKLGASNDRVVQDMVKRVAEEFDTLRATVDVYTEIRSHESQ